MNDLISIIIPIYNVEKYLRECLDSVLAQTYTNLEILLVDDGSTDGSGTICDEYAGKDSRIRVIHQENQGVSAARNLALDLAKGNFISFVDGDDLVAERFLETLYCGIQNTGAEIAACNFHRFQTGEPIEPTLGEYKLLTQKEALLEMTKLGYNSRGEFITSPCNKLYAKGVFDAVRYPVGKRYEDEYVIHKLLLKIESFCECTDVLYFYRQHPGSFMNRNREKDLRWMECFGAYQERCELFKGNEYRDIYPNIVTNYFEMMAWEACTDGMRTGKLWTVYRRYWKELLRYGRWMRGRRHFMFAVCPYLYWLRHVEH